MHTVFFRSTACIPMIFFHGPVVLSALHSSTAAWRALYCLSSTGRWRCLLDSRLAFPSRSASTVRWRCLLDARLALPSRRSSTVRWCCLLDPHLASRLDCARCTRALPHGVLCDDLEPRALPHGVLCVPRTCLACWCCPPGSSTAARRALYRSSSTDRWRCLRFSSTVRWCCPLDTHLPCPSECTRCSSAAPPAFP